MGVGATVEDIDGSVDNIVVVVTITVVVVFGRSITQGTMIGMSKMTPSPIPPPIFN